MSETPSQKAYRLGIDANIKERNKRRQEAIPKGQVILDPKTGKPVEVIEMKNSMSRRELRRQKTKKFQKAIRTKMRREVGIAKAKEKKDAVDN